MRVLCAALLGGEDLDGLVRRSHRVVELLRIFHRHDTVVAAMRDEERAANLPRDVFEREPAGDLDRLVRRRRAHHVLELKVRLRHGLRRGRVLLLDMRLPRGEVPMKR